MGPGAVSAVCLSPGTVPQPLPPYAPGNPPPAAARPQPRWPFPLACPGTAPTRGQTMRQTVAQTGSDPQPVEHHIAGGPGQRHVKNPRCAFQGWHTVPRTRPGVGGPIPGRDVPVAAKAGIAGLCSLRFLGKGNARPGKSQRSPHFLFPCDCPHAVLSPQLCPTGSPGLGEAAPERGEQSKELASRAPGVLCSQTDRRDDAEPFWLRASRTVWGMFGAG